LISVAFWGNNFDPTQFKYMPYESIKRYLDTIPLPFELRTPLVPNKALLIVDTRPSAHLARAVASAVRTHQGWHLYVIGSHDVHAYLDTQCKNYNLATRATLDVGSMGVDEYSRLMLSPQLWQLVREEHILVFQSDCVLVRPTPPECLRYDFMGAVCGEVHPERFVMNGGLSLRRRSAMVRATHLLTHSQSGLPEDVAFCQVMRSQPGFRLPSMHTCMRFSIESMGDPASVIGIHGTDKGYAPPELVAEVFKTLPIQGGVAQQ
jgi:hypothetical protein